MRSGPPPRPGRAGAGAATPILRRRLLAAGVAAVLLFGVVLISSGGDDHGRGVAQRWAGGWARQDWAALHALLPADVQRRHPLLRFARENRQDLATATATRITTGKPQRQGTTWEIPVAVQTRAFGLVRATLELPLTGASDARRVAWTANLTFPGVRRGERLRRSTHMPRRGALLARDGSVLATGITRASPQPDIAGQVVGRLEPIPPARAQELRALGVPPNAQVGASGLERIFEQQLGGVPAGSLRAGTRLLAQGAGQPGQDVRTTIAPDVERAAIAALAGRNGGVVAFDPRDGALLAFAGTPFSQLQPPGSTFKIITAAAALEAGVVKLKDSFPLQTEAVLSGVSLANAGGETCGGTLIQAFAISCNSVFAPLGVLVGARRLVSTAAGFGFNGPPAIAGGATSVIPPADAIGDDLAVGATSIGQGRVAATALQMTTVAGTIADRGRRPKLTASLAEARRRHGRLRTARGEQVVSAKTAGRVQRLMRAVVQQGTGTAAQIPGIAVAGKTGTAEIEDRDPGDTTIDPMNTDAWFVSYAPASGRPRIVVGVLLVQAGTGGASAAPAARGVLLAGLKRD